MPPRLYVASREGSKDGVHFVTRNKVEVAHGIRLVCFEDIRDPVTGVKYKLTPITREGGM